MSEFGTIGDFVAPLAEQTSVVEMIQQPPLKKRRVDDDVAEQPEVIELDEDEIMLRNLTDRSSNKLDVLTKLDLPKLYALHSAASELVKSKMDIVLAAVEQIRRKSRFDLTLAEHRAIKFIFTYIMRSDAAFSDMRDFDRMHHFCIISTPKEGEMLSCIERNLCLQNIGGRETLTGHFIVLLEKVEAKNAQRVSFTAYRMTSSFLKNAIAKKLKLANTRTLFFREVLPKATKNHQILQGHDKYVIGHVSLGEVTRGTLPSRNNNNDVLPDESASGMMLDVMSELQQPRFATYVRVYINTILSYADE